MSDPVNIAVMASGRGSNFRAIHEYLASRSESSPRIVLCISNNPDPGAFAYARENGIDVRRLSPKMFEREEEYVAALRSTLDEYDVDLIVLAGYMRKLPPEVVRDFSGRILNIHPALLPEFGGTGMYGHFVHEAVLAAGRTESGATVHLVDEEYDTGAIVAQERIAIPPGTTPEQLAELVLAVEHRLYPPTVVGWAERVAKRRRSQNA